MSAPTLKKLQKQRMVSLEEEKAPWVPYACWEKEFIPCGEGESWKQKKKLQNEIWD